MPVNKAIGCTRCHRARHRRIHPCPWCGNPEFEIQLPWQERRQREASYVVGVWDYQRESFVPITNLWYGLNLSELRRALKLLRKAGCDADRRRTADGEHVSDPLVLVERLNGRGPWQVRKDWRRW